LKNSGDVIPNYYVNKEYEYSNKIDLLTLKTTQEFKHNLYSGKNIVAVHTRTQIGEQKQVDKTAYLHKDALGSVNIVTDSKGKVAIRNSYTPFGALISSQNSNSKFKKEDLKIPVTVYLTPKILKFR